MQPKTILITGGAGRFAQELSKQNTIHALRTPSKSHFDITKYQEIDDWLSFDPPDIVIHAAALTRPMVKHIEDPQTSIHTNIVGTGYVCMACMKHNIKMIYISTDYVYPGTDGNYKEEDPVLPINEYAVSKMGGECAVQLYDNSLILRISMTERPFTHPKALVDSKKNLLYIDEAASICLKLLDETGIINVGGPKTTPFDFARAEKPDIEKIYMKDISDVKMAKDSSMNLGKLKRALNNEN